MQVHSRWGIPEADLATEAASRLRLQAQRTPRAVHMRITEKRCSSMVFARLGQTCADAELGCGADAHPCCCTGP